MKTQLQYQLKTNSQISGFIFDHLKPITMRKHWDNDLKINFYIQPLINTIDLIMEIGELEHTNDWDPYIQLEYWDHNGEIKTLETESGYYIMEIQNNKLLLEDTQGESIDNLSGLYHIIYIQSIHSISLQR